MRAIARLSGWMLRCRRGASAIEFALAAPVVFLFIIGIIEISMILFVTVLLEGSVREASRYGITGYAPPGSTREDVIRQIIADKTVGLVDMDTIQIEHLVYESFEDIGQPEPFSDTAPFNGTYDSGEPFTDVNGNGSWDPDQGEEGVGGPGSVVVYIVSYDWPLLTGMLQRWVGINGKVPLRASIAVRNEPYGTALTGGESG